MKGRQIQSPLENFTAELFFPADWPATRAWFVTMLIYFECGSGCTSYPAAPEGRTRNVTRQKVSP